MADTNTAANATEESATDPAEFIAKSIEDLADGFEKMTANVESLAKTVDEHSKAQAPWMQGAPGMSVGESVNTSRAFSFSRLAKGLVLHATKQEYTEDCKLEMDFCQKLAKESKSKGQTVGGAFMVPIGSAYMEQDGSELTKEWRQMNTNLGSFDPDEAAWLSKRLSKDLTYRTATTGGTFVDFPQQGELIEFLRASSLWGRIPGVREVPMPQQGQIRYPKVTGAVTITAHAESEAVSESTPTTADVLLQAKKYNGLVEMTEEFMRFSTTVSADAFVRDEITKDIALNVDQDICDGPGGAYIQGLIRYSGIQTHTASTTGANGDTLEPKDPELLLAKIADNNAPVGTGTFLTMRNLIWAALKYREDSQGQPKFRAAALAYGDGGVRESIGGHPVFTGTQVNNIRAKSSGTDLTYVLGGVPSELFIGRSPMMEVKVTDSHGSNFASGIFTMRGTHYIDAVPRHENSFGLIDQLVNG